MSEFKRSEKEEYEDFEYYDFNIQVYAVKLFNFCKYNLEGYDIDKVDKEDRFRHRDGFNSNYKVIEYNEFIGYKIMNYIELIANNLDHLKEGNIMPLYRKLVMDSKVDITEEDKVAMSKLLFYNEIAVLDETYYWFESDYDYVNLATDWVKRLFKIYKNLKDDYILFNDYIKGELKYCKKCKKFFNFKECDHDNFFVRKYVEIVKYNNKYKNNNNVIYRISNSNFKSLRKLNGSNNYNYCNSVKYKRFKKY